MNKENFISKIVTRLEADYNLLRKTAETTPAEADQDSDDLPDSRELEVLAQKQQARIQDILQALETFRQLTVQNFDNETPICLTALVSLVDVRGRSRQVFIGPAAGGLRFKAESGEVMIVTPGSSLGRQLIGKLCGDLIELEGANAMEYEITSVC